MHGHPWRWLRSLPNITVEWALLPEDLLGVADFETLTITLDSRLTQAERRTTCWHEVIHLIRGDVPEHLERREERAVDARVARDLIPFDALVQAMLWSADEWEIADELTVSVDLVQVRLHDLNTSETKALNEALDDAESRLP